jgi:hypothetical protein
MNEQQLVELKRIKAILSAVTGLEDDDQEYIEDARKALQSIISQDAIGKMAENARELGLDYEPALMQQPATLDEMHAIGNGIMYGEQPAPVQELSRDAVLANMADWLRGLADDVTIPYFTNGAFKADCNEAADVLLEIAPPAAQKPWVDLTDEEIMTAPENLIACIVYVRNKLREKNAAPPPAAQPAEECAAILYRDHNEEPWVHVIQKDLPSGTKLVAITKGQP